MTCASSRSPRAAPQPRVAHQACTTLTRTRTLALTLTLTLTLTLPLTRHELASLLVRAGARPDPAALRYAVHSGSLELVRYLVITP